MRIVGGQLRGRNLAGPRSEAIRPTSDRARESLFNILEHGLGARLGECRVLDLFSGTGALGLEALSRGARYCLFVEESVEGRGLLRTNIETLGLTGRTRIFRRDATRLGPSGPQGAFELMFVDPPYGRRLGEAALAGALRDGWLRPGALCMLEEGGAAPFDRPAGFDLEEERLVGETVLRFLRVTEGSRAGPDPNKNVIGGDPSPRS